MFINLVSATSNITISVDGIHTSGSIVGGDFVQEQVDLENAEVSVDGQTYLTDESGITEAIILGAGTYTFTINKEGYETRTQSYEIKQNTEHYLGIALTPIEEECFEECNKVNEEIENEIEAKLYKLSHQEKAEWKIYSCLNRFLESCAYCTSDGGFSSFSYSCQSGAGCYYKEKEIEDKRIRCGALANKIGYEYDYIGY